MSLRILLLGSTAAAAFHSVLIAEPTGWYAEIDTGWDFTRGSGYGDYGFYQ